jgi:dolichol kinase
MQKISRSIAIPGDSIQKELVRKSIHVTIAFVPTMANWNLFLTVLILSTGILFYVANEAARVNGRAGGLVSRLTVMASRPAERGFVWGPVTLGLGTLAALLYYPNPAATLAIYSLAFGDGIASLVGKIWGTGRVAWIGQKSLAGTLSCFLAVLLCSYLVLGDVPLALLTAATATIFELIPIKDVDNLIIPLGTGLVMSLVT